MLKIREAVVVEGRYDKIALSQVVDTVILTTEGFGLFRDREKLALLRRVAETRGLIVLTDSDGAGLVIRNRIRGSIDPALVRHAYIPDVPGKERRKKTPSREGTLGVEGMDPATLEAALLRAGATRETGAGERITKADLCALGLSGGRNAAEARRGLQRRLGLPEKLSPNALLDALNALYARESFLAAAAALLQQQSAEIPHQQDAGGGEV